MPAGLGVTRVITDLGIMSREKPDDELCLTSIHPGVDVETVRKATGWDLRVSEQLAVTARPTPAELNILRGLDLDRVYLR